jgi:hypothetical protein
MPYPLRYIGPMPVLGLEIEEFAGNSFEASKTTIFGMGSRPGANVIKLLRL